jgi:predicted transcriptional regulator
MSDFNYQAYLKNNPLLEEEVKVEKLLTESQKVEEVEIPSASLTKVNAEVKNVQTMAQAILDFIEQVKEKETVDFGANAAMKIVLDKLNTLAKTEEKETEAVAENTEEVTEETVSKMKVSELKAKIKEDIISLLQEEEEEDVEVDVEDEVDVDVEEPALDTPAEDAGLSQDEQDIQDSLKLAYDNAVAIGDQKLADQIGNSITFFTRTHVVER